MNAKTADCGTRGYIWFSDISVEGGLRIELQMFHLLLQQNKLRLFYCQAIGLVEMDMAALKQYQMYQLY